MTKKTWFISAYDEIFINGQKNIGNNNEVTIFDRNRAYLGLGYAISSHLRTRLGFMRQNTSNWDKNQLILSLQHSF